MGKNEDSTRRRVYKSCNIEEKCHEWWLHFPRIKYPWHGVKPTTHHRDNSRLSTIPFALTRYLCPPWKKSNDTEFPFSKFPPHSTIHVVSAGRQRNSISFLLRIRDTHFEIAQTFVSRYDAPRRMDPIERKVFEGEEKNKWTTEKVEFWNRIRFRNVKVTSVSLHRHDPIEKRLRKKTGGI